jgi:phage terminase large subunit GpA-like protein
VILTGGADVQPDGIYYEVVAWARDKESWSIDAGFIPGDTADPEHECWGALDTVYNRRYPNAHGVAWPVDAFAIDSGFNTNQVYMWARTRARAFAVKGDDGWGKPFISTSASQVDINWQGKRMRRGANLWHVGTWPLKANHYAYLRKEGRRDGQEIDPPGFCHFTTALHDERYFKQITSEFVKDKVVNGRTIRVWHEAGPNHFLDCRIYAMAMASHMGVGDFTDQEWAAWVAARARPPKPEQGSLLARMEGMPDSDTAPAAEPLPAHQPAAGTPAASPPPPAQVPAKKPVATGGAAGGDFLGNTDGWL